MRKLYLFAGFAAIALILAACSNSSTSTPPAGGGGTTTTTTTGGGSTGGATVQATQNADFGMILTDAQGHALYLFQTDSGTTSACTGSCAALWPPLIATGKPTAGSGVTASLLGTAKQADGSMQVTYNGHLLYGFTGDTAAGDATGQGVENFSLVSPAGDAITQPAAGSSSSSAYHY